MQISCKIFFLVTKIACTSIFKWILKGLEKMLAWCISAQVSSAEYDDSLWYLLVSSSCPFECVDSWAASPQECAYLPLASGFSTPRLKALLCCQQARILSAVAFQHQRGQTPGRLVKAGCWAPSQGQGTSPSAFLTGSQVSVLLPLPPGSCCACAPGSDAPWGCGNHD